MKPILLFITFLFLVSCSDPEGPAETPYSEDAKSTPAPAPAVSSVTKSRSTIFDVKACKFLTEAQIRATLGDQITDVSIGEPSFAGSSCQKRFTLTLASGDLLNLTYRAEPRSAKGIEKMAKEYADNARNLPRLIKMEMAADGQTRIGTHRSQDRLYVFGSGQESVPTLTFDVRGEAGGQTPEEVEARRQMGLSLINEMLKR